MPTKNKLQEGGIITLHEASEFVDHEILTNRFHVTHYEDCAILFDKDTFCPNVDVKSIISKEVELVASDFNALPMLTGPHHCGDQVPFRTIGQTSTDFSNHLALNVFGT